MFSNASDRTFNKLLEYPGIILFVRVFNFSFVSSLNQLLSQQDYLFLFSLEIQENYITYFITSKRWYIFIYSWRAKGEEISWGLVSFWLRWTLLSLSRRKCSIRDSSQRWSWRRRAMAANLLFFLNPAIC